MAENCGFHGKRSRSWRWWQKTTDVLVKMSQYWSANKINALDVLKAYSYNSWVIQSTRRLSQGCVRVRRQRQFSPAKEEVQCTWVHQCRRPDTQTHRQTNTQTPRQTETGTQDTNTQTPTLLTKEVIERIGIRHCWWIMSYLGRP